MSASCQPGSRVIRAFSDVEKPFFLFSDLAVKAANSENKKGFQLPNQKIKNAFQRQKRHGLAAGYISFNDAAAGGIATSLSYTVPKIQ